MTATVVWLVAVGLVATVVAAVWWIRRRGQASPGLQAAAEALHAAGVAGPPLRGGLSPASAAQALPALLDLLGTPGVALFGADGTLQAALGPGKHHCAEENKSGKSVRNKETNAIDRIHRLKFCWR